MLRRHTLSKITAIFLPAWLAIAQVGIGSQGMAESFWLVIPVVESICCGFTQAHSVHLYPDDLAALPATIF